jgi:hypothetical protein
MYKNRQKRILESLKGFKIRFFCDILRNVMNKYKHLILMNIGFNIQSQI